MTAVPQCLEQIRHNMLRELAFSIESVTNRPLTSSIAGIFSLFPLRLFTYLQNSVQQLPSFFNTVRKKSPAHFVWLITTALVIASVPLDTAALIFFCYMLF
jgi:hypothetical protein